MEKKYFKENDKSQGICKDCGLVSTTFKTIDDVMYGICDSCSSKVSIPNSDNCLTSDELIFLIVIEKLLRFNVEIHKRKDDYVFYGLNENQMNIIKEDIEESILFVDFSYHEDSDYERNFSLGYDFNGSNNYYIKSHKDIYRKFHNKFRGFFRKVNNKNGNFLHLSYYTLHEDSDKDKKNDNKVYINKKMYDFYKKLL